MVNEHLRRHRQCFVLRGARSATGDEASEVVARLSESNVLWVGPGDGEESPAAVRKLLGRSFDAVVVDLHDGLDADLIGRCHGFIRGGGALVLRLPHRDEFPAALQERFAAYPYEPDDVTHRFRLHVERALDRGAREDVEPIEPPPHEVEGTAEQAELVDRLEEVLAAEEPSRTVLVADRGRGKSAALGMAISRLAERGVRRIAVAAASRDAVVEVFRFAGTDVARFVEPTELLYAAEEYDVVVIDEAARLSVPLLRRLTDRHRRARIAYATTTHGYEGTGRGFTLRFVEWLHSREVPVEELELIEPIRWTRGDPLEKLVFDALLLEAEPASELASKSVSSASAVRLDRDELVRDEPLLRDFFGLLVGAHYRTTPGDLHRILDAPNLDLHALLLDRRVVAATLVAEEGDLPAELAGEIYAGKRIRGHALPESLICHLGHREAGPLRMIRSVRIAVHPALRRRGLGTKLIEHVHASYEPDLFGTLFGATEELLRFRRSVGYELVRLSSSRGARTGEPSVVMIYPVSAVARGLLADLRSEFARDLPLQLELTQAGRALDLDDRLRTALQADLPQPATLSAEARAEIVDAYAHGPRTLESAAFALRSFVQEHVDLLEELDDVERTLIEGRLIRSESWEQVMNASALPSYPATMRAMRRAIRRFVQLTRTA